MTAKKGEKTVESLIMERASLEKKLAELEVEEKKRQEEIKNKKEEVIGKALARHFSTAEHRELLQQILEKTLTKKSDRQLFGLEPLPRKKKKAGKEKE